MWGECQVMSPFCSNIFVNIFLSIVAKIKPTMSTQPTFTHFFRGRCYSVIICKSFSFCRVIMLDRSVMSSCYVFCSHHMPSMGPLVWQRGALVISWKGQITHFFYFRTSFDPLPCQDFSRINHYLQFHEIGF